MNYLRLRNGPTVEQDIGDWTALGGVQLWSPNMWDRRTDLRGALIRSVAVPYPTFSNMTLDENGARCGRFTLSKLKTNILLR